MIYHTRRDVQVQVIQFDGTNYEELVRFNCFLVTPTKDSSRLFVVTTFGEDYMNIGDYLVNIADSFLVMTKSTFNTLFK